jgi:hypothetical protein
LPVVRLNETPSADSLAFRLGSAITNKHKARNMSRKYKNAVRCMAVKL